MMDTTAMPWPRPASVLDERTRVTVRDRYLGAWNAGFEVAQVVHGGYRIRRLSDGSVLPVPLPFDQVRRDAAGADHVFR